jgi:hypothetical protein
VVGLHTRCWLYENQFFGHVLPKFKSAFFGLIEHSSPDPCCVIYYILHLEWDKNRPESHSRNSYKVAPFVSPQPQPPIHLALPVLDEYLYASFIHFCYNVCVQSTKHKKYKSPIKGNIMHIGATLSYLTSRKAERLVNDADLNNNDNFVDIGNKIIKNRNLLIKSVALIIISTRYAILENAPGIIPLAIAGLSIAMSVFLAYRLHSAVSEEIALSQQQGVNWGLAA